MKRIFAALAVLILGMVATTARAQTNLQALPAATAAKAYEDFLESGLPIFTCEIDGPATAIAGKFRSVYKLQEVLMRQVTAFRAAQRVDA